MDILDMLRQILNLAGQLYGYLEREEEQKQSRSKIIDKFVHKTNNKIETDKVTLFPGLPGLEKSIKQLNRASSPQQEEDDTIYIPEGSVRRVTKNGHAYWEGRYYDITKKQRSVSAKTKAECAEKLRDKLKAKRALQRRIDANPETAEAILRGVEPATAAATPRYTLLEWMRHWQHTYKEHQTPPLSKSRLNSIRICIEKHVAGNFEDKDIRKVTGDDIQQILNAIESSRMREETYVVLNEALGRACGKTVKVLRDNPCDDVNAVKHTREPGKPLTREEETAFFKNVKDPKYDRFRDYFIFLRFSGARPGEGLKECWQNVDEEHDVIYIHGTKNETSDRVLPLFEPLARLLAGLVRTDGRLFDFTYKYAEAAFKTLCPGHTLKDLRHTFGTRCYESGIALKTIQVWLGHSTIKITEKTYVHLLDEFAVEEGKKVTYSVSPYFSPQIDPQLSPPPTPDSPEKEKDGL